MSGQPGGTRHSHIRVDAMVQVLAEHPELAECFPLADALAAGARWSA